MNRSTSTIEPLEKRCLFSASVGLTTINPTPISPVPVTAAPALLGRKIHAEAGEAFTAVIGTIGSAWAGPVGSVLQGTINWGDGTATSPATFVRQANGAVAVEGSHTYAAVGTDAITITVTRSGPPGTAIPILLLGQIHSATRVIHSPGGVTVEETARQEFTAALGTFRSNLSSLNMVAIIDWGDGTSSVGKILALPTANPVAGGMFEVVGNHAYANTASYLVHVTVTTTPTPIATSATPVVIANFDSVIDVLPNVLLTPVAT